MADTPTTRNRLRKQEVGAKTNAWGGDLNEDGGSDRIDEALDGWTEFALSGNKTLTSTNYETDEARMRVINITGGTGGTVILPAVQKWYVVRNGASGSVVFTNGSNSVSVVSGEICQVLTNGTGIYKSNDKDYADSAILNASLSSELPSQAGNANKFIQTDGTNASWEDVEVGDIFGLDTALDEKADATATADALALKAPLDSPALTGNPTAPTQTVGNNTTRLANTAFVKAALDALVDAAPGALDTLNELAAALGDDPNFATTMTNALALKAALTDLYGVQEIPIPASAITPRLTNGPSVGLTETSSNKIMVDSRDFDQSTAEYAQFRIPMPKRWNEGTVKAQFYWTAGSTGNVVWACRAVAVSDDDALDATFGTAQTVTDGVTAANDVMISAQTSSVTVGGTPATGDWVVFEVYRDAASGSDTLAADAKLLGVKLILTTDAKDDS